jgi:hypothetical protein
MKEINKFVDELLPPSSSGRGSPYPGSNSPSGQTSPEPRRVSTHTPGGTEHIMERCDASLLLRRGLMIQLTVN